VELCRACGSGVHKAFETQLLGRYKVAFFRCTNCRSLQSERPYWLAEAYQLAAATTDTGAAVRTLICQAAIVSIAATFRLRGRFLDYGGGTGLLCRLLRDCGFDAYVYDRYAEPVYARAFAFDSAALVRSSFSLVSAVEVFEHCENPSTDVGALFAMRPSILVATTVPYHGEGEDWWYLSRDSGQHIFFYSPQCLELLARKHGYDYLGVGSFHVFSARAITRAHKLLLRMLLSRVGLRAVQIWVAATRRGRHADADQAMLCRTLTDERRRFPSEDGARISK
jgi:Methyltransferase domain